LNYRKIAPTLLFTTLTGSGTGLSLVRK